PAPRVRAHQEGELLEAEGGLFTLVEGGNLAHGGTLGLLSIQGQAIRSAPSIYRFIRSKRYNPRPAEGRCDRGIRHGQARRDSCFNGARLTRPGATTRGPDERSSHERTTPQFLPGRRLQGRRH